MWPIQPEPRFKMADWKFEKPFENILSYRHMSYDLQKISTVDSVISNQNIVIKIVKRHRTLVGNPPHILGAVHVLCNTIVLHNMAEVWE